jgi:hypothetical protein
MEFELPKDFKELLESLNTNKVRYLLIGGYAVGIYGYSRSTNDLDVFVSNDRENVVRLLKALADFGFRDPGLSEDILYEDRSMIEMGIEPMKVQILNFADGLDFEDCYARKNSVAIEDILVDTISKRDLVKNKTATGRHKDLADVDRLKKLDE